jgi:signal-transduction protein with cAMP-binding, CBS, and nucleotidyltransferase domain
MAETYRFLPLRPLRLGTSYVRPRRERTGRVTLDSPALEAMTDLSQVTAVTVDPNVYLKTALEKMIYGGVRLLLVTSPQNAVIGVITAHDIQGEKPTQFATSVGVGYDEVMVRDIMTPAEQMDVLSADDVAKAAVGDIIATLKRVGRQHALVEETDREADRPAIRGIFSTSQISRQLGAPIDTPAIAFTFAELAQALKI